jgi:hypothetical protein
MRRFRSLAHACRAAALTLAVAGGVLPALFAGSAAALVAGSAAAQGTSGGQAGAAPDMLALDAAVRQQSCTIEQVRRFPTAEGGFTGVREQLQVAANGTNTPDFAVTFLGVEGEPPGSPLHVRWQQAYARHGHRFVTQGGFRVTNFAAAAANYTVHDFGPTVRAGRSARRLVVFPHAFDKSIWLIETDDATALPLYAAEFDTQLQLLTEVEAVVFAPGAAAMSPSTPTGGVADFASAKAAMGNPPQIIEPVTTVTSEYQLDRIEVQSDPLNGQWKLTMTYTDGVDQFVVVQTPGTTDAFAGLPGKTRGAPVIGRYRDAAMSVLVFWDGGVSFQVAGRGSLRRLDALARDIYQQALRTN